MGDSRPAKFAPDTQRSIPALSAAFLSSRQSANSQSPLADLEASSSGLAGTGGLRQRGEAPRHLPGPCGTASLSVGSSSSASELELPNTSLEASTSRRFIRPRRSNMATLVSTGLPPGFGNAEQSFFYGSLDTSPMLGLTSHYKTNLLGQPGCHPGSGASSSFELGHTGIDQDAHTAMHPRPACASASSDSSAYSHSSLSSLFFLPDTSAGSSSLRKSPSPAGVSALNDGVRFDRPSTGAHSRANRRTTSTYASGLESSITPLAHREQQPLCISPKLIMGQGDSEESRSSSYTSSSSSAMSRFSVSVQGSTLGPSPLLLSSSLLFPHTSTESAFAESQTAFNTASPHTGGQEQWMQGLSLDSMPASATSSPAGLYAGSHAPLSGSARAPRNTLGTSQSRASTAASLPAQPMQPLDGLYNSPSALCVPSNMFDIGLSSSNAMVPQPNHTATYTDMPYAPHGSAIPANPSQYSFTGGYSIGQPAYPSIGSSNAYGILGAVPTGPHYNSNSVMPSAMSSSTSMPLVPTSSTTSSSEVLTSSRRGSTGGALGHGAPSLGSRSTDRRPATTSQLPAYGSSGGDYSLGARPPFYPAIPSQLNVRSPMHTSALPTLPPLPEMSATHRSTRTARSSLSRDNGRHALPMARQPNSPESSASTRLSARSYGTRTRQNMQGLLHESDVDRTFPGEWGNAFR